MSYVFIVIVYYYMYLYYLLVYVYEVLLVFFVSGIWYGVYNDIKMFIIFK